MSDPAESPEISISAAEWDSKRIAFLHSCVVVPRPIAWVGSQSAGGQDNLAPHSYFNAVCNDPPTVIVSIEDESDTYRNIRALPEFTISMVSEVLAEQMELTAAKIPYGESEFKWAGVKASSSVSVRPSRVTASPVSMECQLAQIVHVGRSHVVFGRVVRYHIKASVWRDGRVDTGLMQPLARIGGGYSGLSAIFQMNRPSWEEILEQSDPVDLIRRS